MPSSKARVITVKFHVTASNIKRFEDADERNCYAKEEMSPEVSLGQ
jgi:hypothetical protein